jgi:hypothetical protein
MVTSQGRTRDDTERRLAQGAAEGERFRRQLLRTPKGIVCRELDVGPPPENLKLTVCEGTTQQLYTVRPTQSEGSLGRLSLGGPLYKVAQ